jgi:hypothetical protein
MIEQQVTANLCHYIGAELHIIVLQSITQQFPSGVADTCDIYFMLTVFISELKNRGKTPKLSAVVNPYIPLNLQQLLLGYLFKANIWHTKTILKFKNCHWYFLTKP